MAIGMGMDGWFRVWRGCRCQTGWSDSLRNCWRPGRARSSTERCYRGNIAAALWVKIMVEVRAGCAEFLKKKKKSTLFEWKTSTWESLTLLKIRECEVIFLGLWRATINDVIFALVGSSCVYRKLLINCSNTSGKLRRQFEYFLSFFFQANNCWIAVLVSLKTFTSGAFDIQKLWTKQITATVF